MSYVLSVFVYVCGNVLSSYIYVHMYLYMCTHIIQIYIYITYVHVYNIYTHIYICCPIRGCAEGEGLLAVDKMCMRLGRFWLSQKIGMAPKRLLPAGNVCQFHQLVSLVCRQLPPHAAKSPYICIDIDDLFVAFLQWLHVDIRLNFLGGTRLKHRKTY